MCASRYTPEVAKEGVKRLFFGVEVHAPWPALWPRGRLLEEGQRHLTLAFLGNVPCEPLFAWLVEGSIPVMRVGAAGIFDRCLSLPPRHPRVMAWHARFFEAKAPLIAFQEVLSEQLISLGYGLERRPWLPHATLCRRPFEDSEWREFFSPLPFYTGSLHLYASVGNLSYVPLWSAPIRSPFEEIDHTADTAFIVRGETEYQLYCHAAAALCFKSPGLWDFFVPSPVLETFDDLIVALNQMITAADAAIGSPLKGVSFHGEPLLLPDGTFEWEMIVDV